MEPYDARILEAAASLGSPTAAELLAALHARWPRQWGVASGRGAETGLGLRLRALGFVAVQQREGGKRVRRYITAKQATKRARKPRHERTVGR